MATHQITDVAIILKPEDDVAIAKKELPAGTILEDVGLEDAGGRIEVRQDIRPGHKVARRARRVGEAVRRYGQPIGFATADIAVGDHVHTHEGPVVEQPTLHRLEARLQTGDLDDRLTGLERGQLGHRAERRTVAAEQLIDRVVRTTREGMHPMTALAHRSPGDRLAAGHRAKTPRALATVLLDRHA